MPARKVNSGESRDAARDGSDTKSGRAWIGISGWNYPRWRGVFYPSGLRQAAELEFASRQFASIELNGSFYSLKRPENYQAWYDQTPAGFVFAIKGSRYISHLKRLKGVDAALANFFASGVLRLREKLGPFLWQLPPNLVFDERILRRFFELLPRTTNEAAALAKKHDQRLIGRSETEATFDAPLRHALEVRHPSFATRELVGLLREYRVAVCVADSASRYPWIEDLTADFAYVRLHGAEKLYTSGYGPRALAHWAERVRSWARGKPAPSAVLLAEPTDARPSDVFVYFDNDAKVHAPFDAANLQRLLDGKGTKPTPGPLLK